MKRKNVIVGLSGLLLAGALVCFLASRTGSRWHGISVSLVGYTNLATAMPSAAYSGTNKTTGRFAVLRVTNPTRRDFFCYFGPIVLLPSDGSAEQTIQLSRSQTGDFDLAPHGSTTIAVPEPELAGRWQFIVVLCHRHSYSRWQWPLVRFSQKVGLDRVLDYLDGSNRNWFAATPELAP